MKKSYITPVIEVFNVEAEGVIANSMTLDSTHSTDTQFQGGRRSSDWDEFEQ